MKKYFVAPLLLALLIGLGTVVGIGGGIHRPTTKDYDSTYAAENAAGYEGTGMYGATILLSTLSLSALSVLTISFNEILRWSQKQSQTPLLPTA
jgi:hypothetical protein